MSRATLGFSRATRTRTRPNPYPQTRVRVSTGMGAGFAKTQGYITRGRVRLQNRQGEHIIIYYLQRRGGNILLVTESTYE